MSGRTYPRWPLIFIALPAAVAVWSGWVGLGGMAGFGIVHPLPGLGWGLSQFKLNTAITLPIGVEAYGAYALGAWLRPGSSDTVKTFARRSSIGSLAVGMAGQIAFHLLAATHIVAAPWWITMLVACLPVLCLGMGAALAHLMREDEEAELEEEEEPAPVRSFGGVQAKPANDAGTPTTSHRKRARHAPGAPTIEAAEREFQHEISLGIVPKLNEIQKRLQVGAEKAKSYQRHFEVVGRANREAA